MKKLWKRIKVVITAAPFYITVGAAVAAEVTDELADWVPDGWEDNVVAIGGLVATVAAASVAIIRRVTPFFGRRGLLPPGDE